MQAKLIFFIFLLLSLSTVSVKPVAAQSNFLDAVIKSALAGDAEAQFNLGVAYDFGLDLPKDTALAVHWYLKAAEQGNPKAQEQLGYAYREGKSVLKDSVASAIWHQKAAQQGVINSQVALAAYYFLGEGVPKNYALSYAWANLAASKGDKNGIKIREMVEEEMTPSQIAEAQSLSSRWQLGRPIQ